jgi:nicotinamidase-related amidase
MPELQRYTPPARIMNKLVYSAFGSGELHPFLIRRNVHTLIMTGSETDVCVLSSALAADYGYRVIIGRDGVCSSSDESHDALIEFFTRRFDLQIEVAASEEILDAWRPG